MPNPQLQIITLKGQFSAAHFYKNEAWTEEKNREVFGKCFTPHGHGHDYRVEVSWQSFDLTNDIPHLQKQLDALCESLDHKHLNHDIDSFTKKIPTTENIILYLNEQLSDLKPLRIRLYESPELYTEMNTQTPTGN